MNGDAMVLFRAESGDDLTAVKQLFLEYAASLSFNLCFQDFDHELEELPGDYAPPGGAMLLACDNGDTVGCVALRRITASTCEMKRLYVKPGHRGKGIGRKLAEEIIGIACDIGYLSMKLDTIPAMVEAITLYRSLGFVETEPYRYNPMEDTLFLELKLR
jgi:putative acetyltransferase